MAWLSHTDWRCRRPGHEDLGRVVVRIRVQVEPDGKPGQVTVVRPGPDEFNRRAIDCARDESYLPALDAEGHPIVGACEFGIEFLN
jgi:TonB family protein